MTKRLLLMALVAAAVVTAHLTIARPWIAIGQSCALALAAGAAALAIATLTQPPVLGTALLAAGVTAMLGPFPRPGAHPHAA